MRYISIIHGTSLDDKQNKLKQFKNEIYKNKTFATEYLRHYSTAENHVKVVCVSDSARSKWGNLTNDIYWTKAGSMLELASEKDICIFKCKDINENPGFSQDTLKIILDKYVDLNTIQIAYKFTESKFTSWYGQI